MRRWFSILLFCIATSAYGATENFTTWTETDTGYVNVKLDANGDRVVLGRMILLRGLYTECDWDVLTTRASVAPVAMGTALKNNIGFAVGDINYRRNVSLAGVFLDACTTEGNPGTWDTVTLD
jgi:hypothetical protein